jgi:hypothetical protein
MYMNIVTIAFVALTAVAFVHYFYANVLVPDFRMEAELDLRIMQKKLAAIQKANPQPEFEKAFEKLNYSLALKRKYFPYFTWTIYLSSRYQYKHDKTFRSGVDKSAADMDECPIEGFRAIRAQTREFVSSMVMINSGFCVMADAAFLSLLGGFFLSLGVIGMGMVNGVADVLASAKNVVRLLVVTRPSAKDTRRERLAVCC